jgi:S1-C subfamily serine protease
VNLVDVAVVVVAMLAAVRGFRRGLLEQTFEFGGGFAGLFAGMALGPRLASSFTDRPGIEAALISLGVVFVGLSIGQAIGFMIGIRFGLLARRARLGALDAVLGAVAGATVTFVAFWLISSLLMQGPSRPLANAIRRSRVLTLTNQRLPDPPNVLAYLRHYIDTSGFPQVFAGLPPPSGEPVPLPSNRSARRAARSARGSTVRIVAPACGGTQLGSGWVSSPTTVVTNAHVVAGGDDVMVVDSAGSHTGRVVLFDDHTDLAVIRAENLAGRPLELAREDLERGRTGATLGYPGTEGGKLVPHKAAVQARFVANGLDIYGRSPVSREIYEIRSPVRQGDSGGPFVLPGGRVAGVVFAASTTDGETGYALTGSEVAAEVGRAVGRTRAVATGACTR